MLSVECFRVQIMKRIAAALLALTLGFHPGFLHRAAAADGDAEFSKTADEFLAGYLAWRPLTGTMLGLHEYDGKITDYRQASIAAELDRLKTFEKRLASMPSSALSAETEFDRQILLAGIRNELFHFQELAIYTRNPMTYA